MKEWGIPFDYIESHWTDEEWHLMYQCLLDRNDHEEAEYKKHSKNLPNHSSSSKQSKTLSENDLLNNHRNLMAG